MRGVLVAQANKLGDSMKRRSKKTSSSNISQKITPLTAKTDNQVDYITSIIENDVIFCTGPSGSGKSFISAGIASQHLYHNEIDKVVITRPLVCAGKDIGSLPGELLDKIAPYLMPMQEHFRFFLGQAYYGHFFNDSKITYQPLEVMRGSTFDNSYMILDEAQNCTFDQIKMFITRMGKNSKVLINGDVDQTDIRNRSGLSIIINKLKNIKGVGVVTLDYNDIQRNGILGRILAALENDNDQL